MKRSGFKRPTIERKPVVHTPIDPSLSARISYGQAELVAAPKMPEPLRSEPYRRLVASLPCIHCGVAGLSNHAHANSGKAKGQKLDDRLAMPLCVDRPGTTGCHTKHDQRRLIIDIPRAEYARIEREWIERTHEQLWMMAVFDETARRVVEDALGLP